MKRKRERQKAMNAMQTIIDAQSASSNAALDIDVGGIASIAFIAPSAQVPV